MKTIAILVGASLLIAVAGCKDKPAPPPAPAPIVKTGGRELTLSGSKFLIPFEDESGHSDSPGGFTYQSPTLRVTMARGVLYVNSTNFGAIKAGDTVNLLNPGRVFVNDQQRTALPATEMFKE